MIKLNYPQKFEIIYEDNHLIAIMKPFNLLTQADKTGETNLYNLVKQYLKIKYQKPGQVYLGLLHRLDRPVGGIIIFAKTSKGASRLSKQFREHSITKKYLALVEGKIRIGETKKLIHFLTKNPKNNTVNISSALKKNAKKAILEYTVISKNNIDLKQIFLVPNININNHSLLEITLGTGLSHQIRAQLSHIGHPIVGDIKYNASDPLPRKNIALKAINLIFQHPITKKTISLHHL